MRFLSKYYFLDQSILTVSFRTTKIKLDLKMIMKNVNIRLYYLTNDNSDSLLAKLKLID